MEGAEMIDLVLVEPEIPNNTGAIARTCACTGARLHLIKPLGFDISDSAVKRAGLDYWHLVDISVYESIDDYFARNGDADIWLTTTKAPRSYDECDWSGERVTLLFGKETAGLPEWLREKYRDRCIRIPMINEARSLNLSNAAAILTYEALRQQGFPKLKNFGSMKEEIV
jgi:tRNA (cytidine/uridine-2'-O-)-methyltransferase